MKNKDVNSRIKFTNSEIEIIKNSLQHWIDIDIKKFAGIGVTSVQSILSFIKIKTIIAKDEYLLNLNCNQLSFIHGGVAEEYLDYNIIEKDVAINICKNIEQVMRKNYNLTTMDICHPCYAWENK